MRTLPAWSKVPVITRYLYKVILKENVFKDPTVRITEFPLGVVNDSSYILEMIQYRQFC